MNLSNVQVSSHNNKWTEENVKLRNEQKPSVNEDYSILMYGNDLIHASNVVGKTFKYRLEAEEFGQFSYSIFTHRHNSLTHG